MNYNWRDKANEYLAFRFVLSRKLYFVNFMDNFAFIDSQNLNLSIRALGWRLDFRRFRVYLKEKYEVL